MLNGLFKDKEGNGYIDSIMGTVGSLLFFGLLIYSTLTGQPELSELLWIVAVFSASCLGLNTLQRKK